MRRQADFEDGQLFDEPRPGNKLVGLAVIILVIAFYTLAVFLIKQSSIFADAIDVDDVYYGTKNTSDGVYAIAKKNVDNDVYVVTMIFHGDRHTMLLEKRSDDNASFCFKECFVEVYQQQPEARWSAIAKQFPGSKSLLTFSVADSIRIINSDKTELSFPTIMGYDIFSFEPKKMLTLQNADAKND